MKQESKRVTENTVRGWLYNRPRDRDRKCMGTKEDLQRKRGSDESSDELVIYKIALEKLHISVEKDISLTSPSESKQDPAEPTRYKNPAMSPIFFFFFFFFVETTFSPLGLP